MGCFYLLKSMAARWYNLETQVRSSNEAVWGGSFEDLNDPKKGNPSFADQDVGYTQRTAILYLQLKYTR